MEIMENFSKGKSISRASLNLVDLPVDVLVCIFTFCQLGELGRLSSVCKRFKCLISEEFLWRKRCKSLITNQTSSEIIRRSAKLLGPKEKCRIAVNWEVGFYSEKTYYFRVKYMPSLLLETDRLWFTKGNSLYAFQRTKYGLKMKNPLLSLENGHAQDIRSFVKANDVIFSCGQDEQVCGWSAETGKLIFSKKKCHEADIYGIDVNKQILVTGSKDGIVKMWRLHEDMTWCNDVLSVNVEDRVWCVAIDPTGVQVACGSAGKHGIPPLHFYDLESGLETTVILIRDCYTFKRGATIFDLKWESPNTLLTCGFDSFIRMFDIRVGGCVGMWMDPFDAAGYCLATDTVNHIMCGTSQCGRAQLWDKRMLLSVQAFFGKAITGSPVYNLAFDPSQLIIAQDSFLNVMDFTGYLYADNIRKDYRSYWSKNNIII